MEETISTNSQLSNSWRFPLILTGTVITALLLIYYPTTASMIHIWNNSETFAHGYLILPISLWLIWQNRAHFYHINPVPEYFPLPLILIVSFGWLIAYSVDVQVIQQLALVLLIPLIVFTLLGREVLKTAAFPLFFLIFAVPIGEALVPALIEFTADFTVALVEMTGIPIYREGTFFQLPTGSWSVVEACSGVRYLIASVTLGFLYAYLTYQSPYRRAAFIVVAIIVPIFANGLRAFMIVMIGHFSGMKLATGVDHLIYGWIFFGFVITIMFYIGSFWREEKKIEVENRPAKPNRKNKLAKKQKYLLVSVLLLISISLLPLKAYNDKVEINSEAIVIQAPIVSNWSTSNQLVSDWIPRYKNLDSSLSQNYQQREASIDFYIGYYLMQRDKAQLITSTNVLTEEKNDKWRNIGESLIEVALIGGSQTIPIAHLKSGSKEILVAYFYYLDGKVITNDYLAKLIEAKTRLLGNNLSASIIAISSELNGNHRQTVSDIQSFVNSLDKQQMVRIKTLIGKGN